MPVKLRLFLYVALTVLLALTAGISEPGVREPGGAWLRVGIVLMSVGAAMWLRPRVLAPAVAVIWLAHLVGRLQFGPAPSLGGEAAFDLLGLWALAGAAYLSRATVGRLEAAAAEAASTDHETGLLRAALLRENLEREVARSRRFGREFALMLVGVAPQRQRFDYRDDGEWTAAYRATARVLSATRAKVDSVFRYGERSFALLLPETGRADVAGLVRRLGRLAKLATPAEGEPGGPLPTHAGVTFFPECATSAEDLIRRAEVAMRVAERRGARVAYDSAEAPPMPEPESLRRASEASQASPPQWLPAPVPPDEERDWPEVGAAPAPVWLWARARTPRPGGVPGAEDVRDALACLSADVEDVVALLRGLRSDGAGSREIAA